MPFSKPSAERNTFLGTGTGVCLYMWCGLGDCIQALPVIAELARREKVTILTELNKLEFWQLIRETIPIAIREQTSMMKAGFADEVWLAEAKKEFARVHILHSWTTWETPLIRDTMEAFAECVGGVIPVTFSYREFLKPERERGSYILFAPESTEDVRTLSDKKAREIFQALPGNVIWLSKFQPRIDEEEFGNLCDSIDDDEQLRVELFRLHEEAEARERIRMEGKTECRSFAELRDIIYNADRVVTVESGVANLAGALGKDMVILCSVTDPLHIVGQYKRFHSFEYTTVHPEHPYCGGVCWRKADRGHGFPCAAQCLDTISTEKILEPILQ